MQLSKQAINHCLIFRLGGFLSHLKEVCVDTQCFLVHFRVGFASYKTKNSKSKILKNNKKKVLASVNTQLVCFIETRRMA